VTTETAQTEFDSIDDPGEYNQKRRLKQIADTRDRVFQQRRHALDLEANGEIGEQMKRTIIREAVADLVLEVEHLITAQKEDGDWPGQQYWKTAELGSVAIPEQGQNIPVNGLKGFLEFPNPAVVTWVEEPDAPPGFSTHPDREQRRQRSKQIQLPEEISMRAFRSVTEFLKASGLDAELEEQLPEHGFRELDDDELAELQEMDSVVLDDR